MFNNLLLIAFLFFAYFQGNSQTAYVEEFKKKWQNAADYTMELAESMPDSLYEYKPSEEQRTFKEQLLHMVGNMAWLSSKYLDGQRPEQDLKSTDYSKEGILQILKDGFRLAGEAAAKLSPLQLEEKVDFFAGPMTKRQILTLMNDHLTHHRGQLIVYVRLKGIKPPPFRGW